MGGPLHRLCPSCSQKWTLLFGEYMNEQLLQRLPHRQFVFTIPKVLRVFFRQDRRLHGEVQPPRLRFSVEFHISSRRESRPRRRRCRVSEFGQIRSAVQWPALGVGPALAWPVP